MKRVLLLLLAGVLLAGAAGCGNDRDRGKNKDLDKPQSPEKNK